MGNRNMLVGVMSEYLDVDVDTLSYFELKDYIKELGYNSSCKFSIQPHNCGILGDIENDKALLAIGKSLQHRGVLEVYVHMPEKESCSPFNKGSTFNCSVAQSNTVAPSNTVVAPSITAATPPNTAPPPHTAPSNIAAHADPIVVPAYTTAALSNPESSQTEDYSSEDGSDESTEDSDYCEDNDFFWGDDYGSDVHEEYIKIRKESRSFQRRKRKEKVVVDTKDVPCGDAGLDLGFDETETCKTCVEGGLGGDEPYYPSSNACSFETDENECWNEDGDRKVKLTKRRSTSTKSVKFDKTCKKIVWQLGMIFESVDDFRDAVVTRYALQKRVLIEKHVNEPTRFRVRCTKDNCNWLLFVSLDSVSNNFVIRTYNPVHKCERASRNYLCNSKFLANAFKDRITEQPNIRVFKLQELIKKKFKVHVGKTIATRARAKVLQQIMGDHNVKFGRILDYRDELLRTNLGSTCVVKLGEPDKLGRPVFVSFYICFKALKNAFLWCKKCKSFDGCFLKGVSRGQLLVVVAKNGNNQMLPLAWAVVEYEKKTTWSWFLTLLKEDLGLGDGTCFI
uniref:Transposase MuDR plant domain-containing protein n=1 Tax=Nicotiana tabacum TaxID=4097 RepID=A0A1S4A8R0_TOBAC|nr:PREDICTED: uncharacterized protein LOC107794920 [Nicotiana tabacum]